MNYWLTKTAIVTGGSSGLGLAIASALVERGVNTVIVARDAGKLEVAAASLRVEKGDLRSGRVARSGDRATTVLPVAADITRQADVERMVGATVERFGRLDLLVNCAGSSARGEVLSTTVEDFRQLMELNFFATVRATLAAMPHLLAARGHVVNIGSLASKSASRYMGGYAASKFAVAAYSQQLRLELTEQGLHVLLVCPGPIARDEPREYVGAANLPDAAKKPGAGVKVGRIRPEDLARRILSACEKRKSEIVIPAKARLLFAISQLSPSIGDWLVRKLT